MGRTKGPRVSAQGGPSVKGKVAGGKRGAGTGGYELVTGSRP